MNEKPIERLSFYNGERLNADDFKLEQEYHIRVRRWLNKSLYSAGIAGGLEVSYEAGRVDPQDRPVILVSPGMALDNEGREMIVVEQAEVPIIGRPNPSGQPITGNYLFIQYSEEKRAEESDSMATGAGKVAWGGPSRVRAQPVIGWSDEFPNEGRGRVVLAQVQLDQSCVVQHIFPYPRRYIGPASNMVLPVYALEGERNINQANPGRIYFHIRGRQPNAVTLYLRADKFSTLFYTELGSHNHDEDATGKTGSADPKLLPEKTAHHHAPGSAMVADDGTNGNGINSAHENHGLQGKAAYLGQDPGDPSSHAPHQDRRGWKEHRAGFFLIEPKMYISAEANDGNELVSFYPLGSENPMVPNILEDVGDGKITGGSHKHTITGDTADNEGFTYDHKHTLNASGVSDVEVRSGPALTYLKNLQVYIGRVGDQGVRPPSPDTGSNYLDAILEQLKAARPTIYGQMGQLGEGNGDNGDPLYYHGTGPIRLDLLSPNLSFSDGEYYIDLAVENESGGRILYNLYVE